MRDYATAGRSCADPDAVLAPRLSLQLLLLLLLLLLHLLTPLLHALLHMLLLAYHHLGARSDQRERSAHVMSHCAHATPRSKPPRSVTHAASPACDTRARSGSRRRRPRGPGYGGRRTYDIP